jgi:hypothetical protein
VAWRDDRVRFWAAVARGLKTEDAASEAGVSSPVAFRWFRHAGGVNPCLSSEVSGRYLSFVEREDIAILRAQDLGVREIARRLNRDPSTISRELRRKRLCEYVQDRLSGVVAVPAVELQARWGRSGTVRTSRIAGIAAGCRAGARSRSRAVFVSSSPMMSRCGGHVPSSGVRG